MEDLRKKLAEHAERLERFIPEGMVIVRIDGKDVVAFNLDVTNRVQFTVDNEEAERIEIFAQSARLVLAIHLLNYEVWESPNRKNIYTVRHENGAKITFIFKREDKLSVTVTYEETSLRRVLALLWRHQRAGRRAESRPKVYANPIVSKVIVVTLLIFMTLGIFIVLNQWKISISKPSPSVVSGNSPQKGGLWTILVDAKIDTSRKKAAGNLPTVKCLLESFYR